MTTRSAPTNSSISASSSAASPLAANVGSGSPREVREWVEYCNAAAGALADERAANGRREPWKVRLWGIGNETWGCGGRLTAEQYTPRVSPLRHLHPRFPPLAALPYIAVSTRNDDFHWTDVLMRETFKFPLGGPLLQGLSLHYYTVPGDWAH